jgi:fluoroquinolone transport system ATP-binding protein
MIRVDGLSFGYPGTAARTLHGLTFDVGRGEIFGFLGPSGAGKSTTQKILTRLLEGYGGLVEMDGRDLRLVRRRSFYERIGVGFEVPNVYGRLTARENLAFFASLYHGRTRTPEELLALVGLDAAIDQRVSEYSKGMRMRLNFARALLRDPELLFLDEPTAGLDPENARRVKDVIRARRAAGATVFLTTHDMGVAAELCDRVAFLVEGRIAVIDAPRALMVQHGRRRLRVDYSEDGAAATAEFDLDALAGDAEFQRILHSAHIDAMHSLDATLEDVFLAVTGRTLA